MPTSCHSTESHAKMDAIAHFDLYMNSANAITYVCLYEWFFMQFTPNSTL